MKRHLAGRGSVLTIGGYDGIHVGHQALLGRVRDEAAERQLPGLVMSFEPLPKEYFRASNPPARLTRFRERFSEFERLGMDGFFCPRFDSAMAAIGVNAFIDELLVDTLGVRHLVIGDDFRFGHKARGGVDDLISAGTKHGFSVEQVGSVFVGGVRVSATLIREALGSGDMATVRQALGRAYRLSGRVVHGQQLGRTLGYPTANIRLHRRTSPVSGIFAVRIDGVDGETRDGVASIGTRPTVDGVGVLLEVYVFDYSGDLYGQRLGVELVAKIRNEVKFDSLDALTEQMRRDEADARAALADAQAGPAAAHPDA